ncbi:hypothetical protein [Endozoicomonas sp.]
MSDEYQVQCAECFCTLYFVTGGLYGITGELCDACQSAKDEEDWDDDDD